MRTVRDATEYN